ncbi:hypothetical protein BS17DRAFT_468424 [Gyrodon lividus]|nr:hypothetical protein BS17DRAFT_468424 [Gyrodon lividus]
MRLTFTRELSWDFPIFISTPTEPNNWCKFTPNSDISVTSPGFLCPFVLCEVVSDATETDRWRMLIEAIAAVRAGYHITKCGSADDFFVVAIYIRAHLTAERYILVQPASNGKVSFAQRDFDLTDSDEAVDFLREMYNLTTKIDALARGLDPSKKSALIKVAEAARPVISLTEQAKRKKTKTNAGSTIGSIVDCVGIHLVYCVARKVVVSTVAQQIIWMFGHFTKNNIL